MTDNEQDLTFHTQIFKALSDESRVRILHLLLKNEKMCISDLENILEFTQTKTSRHLIYLKNAGITSWTKTFQWSFYYIRPEVRGILEKMMAFIDQDETLRNDLENYNILYTNRELAINRLQSHQMLSEKALSE